MPPADTFIIRNLTTDQVVGLVEAKTGRDALVVYIRGGAGYITQEQHGRRYIATIGGTNYRAERV